MSTLVEPRHTKCSICSQIHDEERATEYVNQPEANTKFPQAVNDLKTVRDIRVTLQLMQCPECGTFYLLRTKYEYVVGFSGSYDEHILWRLSDETGLDYLEGRLSRPPTGMI